MNDTFTDGFKLLIRKAFNAPFKHKTSKTYKIVRFIYIFFPYNLHVPLLNSLKNMKRVFMNNDEIKKMRIYFKN